MKSLLRLLFFLAFALTQSNVLRAQTILDYTFGDSGTVRAFINGGVQYDAGAAVAIQSDGKIVVVGTTYSGGWKFGIARLDTNGSLDSSFGTNGTVSTWINGGNHTDDEATCVLIQADGKILVGGFSYISTSGGNRFAAARFKSDGTLDTGFGTNGTTTAQINGIGNDHAYSIALQSDGKIILGGGSNPDADFLHYYYAVMRLNANGTLDGTFGTSGASWLLTNTNATGMTLQQNDKIILAGPAGGHGLVRYGANGSLDSSFGTNGSVSGGSGYYSVAMQSGKVVAGGAYTFAITRFDTSGNVDSTFGTNGTSSHPVSGGGGNDQCRAIAVQSDGKIVIVGDSYDASSNDEFGIQRLNPDGSLDNTFGTNGSTRLPIRGGNGTSDRAFSVAIQPNQQIVAAGYSDDASGHRAFAVARFLSLDIPLMVQASSFTAKSSGGSVILSWKTQSEVNNAGFNVLRKDLPQAGQAGTNSFKPLANYASDNALKGMGTSTSGRNYSFTDTKVKSGASYQYKIQSVSIDGTTKDLTTLSVTVKVPEKYGLSQNYPNPFNPATTISYQLAADSHVTLRVYDVLGREVATLVNETKSAGEYTAKFDGSKFASGVYTYRLQAGTYSDTKRLLLLK